LDSVLFTSLLVKYCGVAYKPCLLSKKSNVQQLIFNTYRQNLLGIERCYTHSQPRA